MPSAAYKVSRRAKSSQTSPHPPGDVGHGLVHDHVGAALVFGQQCRSDSALTARRLSENGRTIVASPDYLARWAVPETPEDLYNHNCLNFSFRRAEPVWPFRRDGVDFALKVRGAIEANSGETLGQLALDGVGIARVGNFSLGDAISEGRLVPLLEPFNPGDKEIFHAVFVGGANMPARVRVFVDYLAECMGGSRGRHQ